MTIAKNPTASAVHVPGPLGARREAFKACADCSGSVEMTCKANGRCLRAVVKALARRDEFIKKPVASKITQLIDDMFDPSKHPRYPKGHPLAGQFMPKGRSMPIAPASKPPAAASDFTATWPKTASTKHVIGKANAIEAAGKAGDLAALNAIKPYSMKAPSKYEAQTNDFLDKWKAHAAAKPAIDADMDAGLKLSNLTKTGAKPGGAQPGALYKDKDGNQWLVKAVDTDEHALNEVLANRLYKATGVDVPTLKVIRLEGQYGSKNLGVASKWLDEPTIKVNALSHAQKAKAQEGFASDAWLANRDAVGANGQFDNIVVGSKSGGAYRVDVGGSIGYTGLGSPKAFAADIKEWDALRNPAINKEGAFLFGSMTADQLTASAAKVAAVDDETIIALVGKYGPTDIAAKKKLAATLIARRDAIGQHAKAVSTSPAVQIDAAKFPQKPTFVSSKPDQVTANMAKMRELDDLAMTGDVAALQNAGVGIQSPKVAAYHSSLVANVKGQIAPPPAAIVAAATKTPAALPPKYVFKSFPSMQKHVDAMHDLAEKGDLAGLQGYAAKIPSQKYWEGKKALQINAELVQAVKAGGATTAASVAPMAATAAASTGPIGAPTLAQVLKDAPVAKVGQAKKIGYFLHAGDAPNVTPADLGIPNGFEHKIAPSDAVWGSTSSRLEATNKALGSANAVSTHASAIKKLTTAERDAIRQYTSNGYSTINNAFRMGSSTATGRTVQKALEKAPVLNPGTLLSRKFGGHNMTTAELDSMVGKVVQEPGVVSTAVDFGVWNGTIQMRISTAPGVRGLYVGKGSTPNAKGLSKNVEEMEVLLPPDTRFVVTASRPIDTLTDDEKKSLRYNGAGLTHVLDVIALPPA